MTGRNEGDTHPAYFGSLSIAARLAVATEILAISLGHDGQGQGRGKDGPMSSPGMIGMTMGDSCTRHGPDRVDVEVTRWAVQAHRSRM